MEYQFESIGPALRIITLVFLFVAVLAFIAVVLALAALPGTIAKHRQHPQAVAINACGWFGLPTGILWVVAIVWAYYRHDEHEKHDQVSLDELVDQITQLEKSLAKLEAHSQGASS